jgi:carboxylesterase type B
MPQHDAGELASPGVVVTVNYRLGFEGFGQLPGVRPPPPATRGGGASTRLAARLGDTPPAVTA